MFWDDLDTNDGSANDAGDIYFQEMPDRVIFQYEGVTRDADDKTATNTFQAVLHGDGGIDIRYKELNGFLEQATVGIENPEGDGGIEVVHNAPYLEENLALKFQPVPVTFVTVSPLSGTTPVAGVSTLAVTFDSTDMKPGVYTAAIEIAHNGTGTTPWTIPAVLEVLNQPAAITLTEPSNESWFWLGEGVSLRALATDTDYGLERVEFFADDQFLDSDATASYQEYWVPTEQGVYDLTARAIDRFDTVTVSDPVQIRVLEDVDGDQMPDDWEIANFGDTAREASADADGDGFPNIFEYHFGTDPNESTSHPEFSDEQEFVSPDPRVGSIRYFLVDGVSDTEFRKSSIRNAVSAADDFDIIEVGPGFYPGTLNLYDWVYLFSSEGARTTTIDGDGANDNVAYISENVVLEGFTLQNGYRSSDGAGLYILGSYSRNIQPRIIGCVIRNNRAGDEGGGAYIRYAHPVFINCTLADNIATTGNGIHLSGTQSDVTLINTLLWNPGPTEISGSGIITSQHSLVRDPATGNLFLDGVDMGTSDPGLGFDLGLTAQSIARDAGTGSLHARIDADGEDYSDSAPDIGADEFHDADGDGLPDWIEMQGITEATEDTDGDTLGNLAEYATHGTDPRNGDVDDDGLDDAAEIAAGTNASKADTDGDSLPDGWEVQYGLDPLDGNTGDEDPDGDTLLNSEEFALGTDPTSDDTDGDGLKDHIESTILASLDPINFFYLSPLIADSDGDGILDGLDSDDGDGLSNLEEIAYGTDPNRADTDLDGVFDDIELDFGFDPLVANAFATDDSDLDGLTDLFEINFGTDPLDDDTNDNGMKDGEELDNGGDPINPGPPPPPLNPGVPPAPDPNLPAPDPIIPGDYDILVETVSIAQPKHGFAPYEEIDPTKRFLKQSSTQSFSGGNPESGPLNVNGSKTISIDLLTGDSETTGDSFVNTGGDPQSPTRKSGSHEIGSYDDPPNQETDHDATLSYDSVLSDEYLTEDLITNGMSELPGYQNQFAPGTPYAYRNLHENELRFDSRKVQFKFKWHTDVTEEQRHPIKWFILFTPEDDPNTSEVDESQQIEIVGDPIEWAGDTEESPLSEIDPNSLKPDEDGDFRLIQVDLDIDGDNTNGAGAPDRSLAEEALEDDDEKLGKLIGVNNGDLDFDNIPDYADGFDGETLTGVEFTKLVLEMPDGIENDKLFVKFIYDASDPGGVTIEEQNFGGFSPQVNPDRFPFSDADGSSSEWTTRDGRIYKLNSGRLRIWKKDASESRNSDWIGNGGDFIPYDTGIKFSDLTEDPAVREVVLYVEAVKPSEFPGDFTIKLQFGIDSGSGVDFVDVDTVRVTPTDVIFKDVSGAGLLARDNYTSNPADFSYSAYEADSFSLEFYSMKEGGSINLNALTLPAAPQTMNEAVDYTIGERGQGTLPVAVSGVSPDSSGNVVQSLSITGNGTGLTYLDAHVGETRDGRVTAGSVGIAVFPLKELTLGVRRVHQRYSNPDFTDFDAPVFEEVDKETLESQLNEIYKDANISVEVLILPEIEVDYDEDRDGKLDRSVSEYGVITANGDDPLIDFVLFLVSGIEDAGGFSTVPGRFPFQGYWYTLNRELSAQTSAHELGHALGLHHPFEYLRHTGNLPNDYDPENLMNYTDHSKLRLPQWIVINPFSGGGND